MANFEKIIKGTDAVLNCIPIVSTINNAAQALYKLAYKVDTLNPVVPGLKTSIQIHILSKDNFEFLVKAIPIVGNVIAFKDLVLSILRGFDDDFAKAVSSNNEEVVRLCLRNNALNSFDESSDAVLYNAASCSNPAVFAYILNHRQDWVAGSLMNALNNCGGNRHEYAEKANQILDYWKSVASFYNLEVDRIFSGWRSLHWQEIDALHKFLRSGEAAIVGRIIQILPVNIPFRSIQEILLPYSCTQYDDQGRAKETMVLTVEQRHALIDKSGKPSLQELQDYYRSVALQLFKLGTTDQDWGIHLDTLHRLLDLAQLSASDVNAWIGFLRRNVPILAADVRSNGDEACLQEVRARFQQSLLAVFSDCAPVST